jgi:predicted DNA-binding ribbon-helix-helix protein
MPSSIARRNIRLANERIYLSLEPEFWECLRSIGAEQGVKRSNLVAKIAAGCSTNLSSAVRVYVLSYYRDRHVSAE